MLGAVDRRGQRAERPREPVQGERVEGSATTVDRDVAGLLVGKIIDGPHDGQLGRMIGIAVAGEVAGVERRWS